MKIGSKDYEIYDESRKCAKCGKTGASSEYVYKNPLCFFETPNIPNEFIERICLNCGYKWWELPADYKDKSAG
jgi:predicted nucleic-acid-binding Zn-ribbon protein